ncbi:ankyrin repeat domain-containing protein [Pannonibacter carbonis]|uniref:ankyrin repeat domain-containing protein n=1 Tax=Pannonibacter carbonis TaxID=2067569 RepID=UPI0013005E41|nr:ankyrin repeat domain-containing protein [Pannonibacter carbonis]
MKRSILLLAICLGIGVGSARADAPPSRAEFSKDPVIKLGVFATACSAPQVKALLTNDRSFDINAYPATLTPVQLAMARLLKAIVAFDLSYQNACLATISTIMQDERYRWRETGPRQNTDLTYFLRNTAGVAGNTDAYQGYRTATFVILDILKRKPDFDINYRLQTGHGPNYPATAAGAAAAGGLGEIWCDTLARMPEVNLEERRAASGYTPLLIAIANRKTDMVKRLIGAGADYLVQVDGIKDFAAEEIARSVGANDILTFLIAHRQGLELGTSCLLQPSASSNIKPGSN